MQFKEALELMINENTKVKLPAWGGYWCWDKEKQTVMMHCRAEDSDKGQGPVLDIRETQRVEYTLGNICSDKWIIADEKNCPVLGGVATFDFQTAFEYLKRGLSLTRLGWKEEGWMGESIKSVCITYFEADGIFVADIIGNSNNTYSKTFTKLLAMDMMAIDWCFTSCENKTVGGK